MPEDHAYLVGKSATEIMEIFGILCGKTLGSGAFLQWKRRAPGLLCPWSSEQAGGEPCNAPPAESSLVPALFPCQYCHSSAFLSTRGKGCAPLAFICPSGLCEADGWRNPLVKSER